MSASSAALAATPSDHSEAMVLERSPPGNNTTTVQQEKPASVGEDGDTQSVRAWLSRELASRLGNSAINISQGQYQTARGVLGDEYSSLLSKYVEVTGETAGSDDLERVDRFQTAAQTQTAYAETLREYQTVYERYQTARANGNVDRARRLARKLLKLSERLNRLGNSLTKSYTNISVSSGVRLQNATAAIANTTENLTEQTDAVVQEVFSVTTLVASAEPNGSFSNPVHVSGRLTANQSTLPTHVTIQVGSQRIPAAVAENGSFTIAYRPTAVPCGPQTLEVAYIPNATAVFLGSNTTVSTNINQVSPSISLSTHAEQVQYGDRLKPTGRVMVSGTPVSDVSVVMRVAGVRVAQTRTTTSGKFDFNTTLPAAIQSGTRTITVHTGAAGSALAPVRANASLEILKTATDISVAASKTAGTIRVEGQLQTATGHSIQGQAVTVQRAGTVVTTLRTNESGYFTATIPIPESQNSTQVTLTAQFDGSGTSLASARASATVSWNVNEIEGGLPVIPLGVGAVSLLAIGGGFVVYRYRTADSDLADADQSRPDQATEADSREAASDVSPGERLEAARTRIESGDVDTGIRVLYGAVRESIHSEGGGQTHWEFFNEARSSLEQPAQEALREVTEAYEAVEFASQSLAEPTATAVLEAAHQLVDTPDRNQYPPDSRTDD